MRSVDASADLVPQMESPPGSMRMPSMSKGTSCRRAEISTPAITYDPDRHPKPQPTVAPRHEGAPGLVALGVARSAGGVVADSDRRITFEEMRELLFRNYASKENRTDPVPRVRRLTEFFGSMLGEEITEERIVEYSRKRLEMDGAEAATLRRELAILKRMLRLASPRLPRIPLVTMPRVDNARQGYFEEEELQVLLPHLPAHARNLVEFLYLTGWRTGEAFRLQWRDVDWNRQTVLLRVSKNREPRSFPFKHHPRLEGVLMRQRAEVSAWERAHERLCPAVFHWRGRSMKKLRRSWRTACAAAGLRGRLLHDFRRTAVRNLIRAGVQQAIAMRITGHKTDSSFRRYLIVDEEMLAQATGAVAEFLEARTRRVRPNPQ